MESKDPTGSRISKKVNYTSPLSAIIPCSQSQQMILILHGLPLRTQKVKALGETSIMSVV